MEMKGKLLNSIFATGLILVFITVPFVIIYEYVIWDKSFIPDVIINITFILGFIGVILIVLWYFLQKKKK